MLTEVDEAYSFWEKVEMDKEYFLKPQPQMEIIRKTIENIPGVNKSWRICE